MIPTWLTWRYLVDGGKFAVAFRERLRYDGGMTTVQQQQDFNTESDRLWNDYRCDQRLVRGDGQSVHCSLPTHFDHQEWWSGVGSEVRVCSLGHESARSYED